MSLIHVVTKRVDKLQPHRKIIFVLHVVLTWKAGRGYITVLCALTPSLVDIDFDDRFVKLFPFQGTYIKSIILESC